jgi:hypothetical protein
MRTDAEHYERVCRLLGFGIRVQFVPGGRCDHCDAIATTLVLVRCEHPAVTVSVCTDCLEGDSVRAVVDLINRRTTKRTQPTMTIQRTAETDDLYTMLGGFVVNMCPKDTPWLTMDDDFVRDPRKQSRAPSLLSRAHEVSRVNAGEAACPATAAINPGKTENGRKMK